jgi:hypothetical protein
VTHQVRFLPQVDQIIVLRNGVITEVNLVAIRFNTTLNPIAIRFLYPIAIRFYTTLSTVFAG